MIGAVVPLGKMTNGVLLIVVVLPDSGTAAFAGTVVGPTTAKLDPWITVTLPGIGLEAACGAPMPDAIADAIAPPLLDEAGELFAG